MHFNTPCWFILTVIAPCKKNYSFFHKLEMNKSHLTQSVCIFLSGHINSTWMWEFHITHSVCVHPAHVWERRACSLPVSSVLRGIPLTCGALIIAQSQGVMPNPSSTSVQTLQTSLALLICPHCPPDGLKHCPGTPFLCLTHTKLC